MGKRQRLTKRAVDAVATPSVAAGQAYVWDDEVRGLALRLRAAGGKRWVFRYRFRGRQRFVTIGEHGQPWTAETARDRAKVLQGLVASGTDPAARRETLRNAPTMAVAAERWLREHAAHHKAPASVEGDRYMLARLQVAYVDLPADRKPGELGDLGRSRVDAVTREQVAALHHRLASTPVQANRAVALLSAIFTWSGRVAGDNPCRGVRRFREEKRERFLAPAELARLGAALAACEEPAVIVAAIQLLLFTGARMGEILGARRADVDLRARTLRVARPKEGKPKLIRLGAPAVAIIKRLPRMLDNPWLLPGRRIGAHLKNIEPAWQRIRTLAGLEDVHLHDLRHSYASVVAAGGASLPMIGALLGHRAAQTTLRYAHLGADPLRATADGAARTIEKALRGKRR